MTALNTLFRTPASSTLRTKNLPGRNKCSMRFRSRGLMMRWALSGSLPPAVNPLVCTRPSWTYTTRRGRTASSFSQDIRLVVPWQQMLPLGWPSSTTWTLRASTLLVALGEAFASSWAVLWHDDLMWRAFGAVLSMRDARRISCDTLDKLLHRSPSRAIVHSTT